MLVRVGNGEVKILKKFIFRTYFCGINLRLYTVIPASSKEEALNKIKDAPDCYTYKFWKVIEDKED